MSEQEWTYSTPIKAWELDKSRVLADLAQKTRERFPELDKCIDAKRMYFCLRLHHTQVEKGILYLTYRGDWILKEDADKDEDDGD
jgi:hypothetical protein